MASKAAILIACVGAAALAHAQTPAGLPPGAAADTPPAWQQCQDLSGNDERLACYDRGARQQTPPSTPPSTPPASASLPAEAAPPPAEEARTATVRLMSFGGEGCRDRGYSAFSRLWELEPGSSCGTLGLRGYRPMGILLSVADGAPPTPTSPSPDHTAQAQDYRPEELRLNLSLRTKLVQGLFTGDDAQRLDSVWFGYTQQSTWQITNDSLSRPFRTTDHEVELMYVYPVNLPLPGGWRWRYAGIGAVHQSNGQSLPLSRSWNRAYLMGGVELDDTWRFTARAWRRIREQADDDDNPDIAHYIGRAEFSGWWDPDGKNSYGITWRTFGRGSVRLEWLHALGNPDSSNLRLHVQLFNGYGDTLAEYNRSRTVFSIGLSLVDF
jgi:phospholipase A1